MNHHKKLFEMLACAPDGQLAASEAIKFKTFSELDTNPKSSEIKDILDICAYAALASEFTMLVMDNVWRDLLKIESETHQVIG